jgi:manganese oxidase
LQGTPGAPMGDDYGPAPGRGLGGVGNDPDTATTNGPMSGSMMNMPEMGIAPNANSVPNFPQDAFMESPMMAMDQAVDRPENYGLARGWSGYMQGMMTFIRVLPPEKYDEVVGRMQQARRANDPYQPIYKNA